MSLPKDVIVTQTKYVNLEIACECLGYGGIRLEALEVLLRLSRNDLLTDTLDDELNAFMSEAREMFAPVTDPPRY